MEQMMDEKKENLIREKKVEEQIELIQVLLKNGADPSCKNSEGFISRELTSNSSVCIYCMLSYVVVSCLCKQYLLVENFRNLNIV